ncbi:MAG: isochorismatase family protein [Candidatus Peribacteria bacterium]|nr:MAG: isochorismatase family protein [Candidatus Peribacteria bacterium]
MTNTLNSAHLLIDYQNDFVDPNGQLYVQQAEKIGAKIAEILSFCQEHQIINIASEDRHPEGHVSFASRYGKEPFSPTPDGRDLLWPDHCIAGTW